MADTSFPFMRVARYLGADYGRILRIADGLDKGIDGRPSRTSAAQ